MTCVRVRFPESKHEIDAAIGENLLDAALRQHVAIDHACGGVCACSTCHVKIVAGADALSPAEDDELDQLDKARGVGLNSRLACQSRVLRPPQGGAIEVVIPNWNVNLVREGG